MSDLIGIPEILDPGCLPTKASIYNYFLKTREDGIKEGRWKHNVPVIEIINIVEQEVQCQWEKTPIPTLFTTNPQKAKRMISRTVEKAKSLIKIPVKRRKENFGRDMNVLLDLASCQHSEGVTCTCTSSSRVPLMWSSFLQDQRGSCLQGKQLTRQ